MRRAWRIAAVGASAIAVGVLALVLRVLSTAGVFSEVTPDFAGTCQAIPGIDGGADIAVDRRAGLAFVAGVRLRPGHGQGAGDGLYLVQIAHPELGARRLSGTPKDFHPFGLSLYRAADGRLTLMAVNHRRHGQASIDLFDVSGTQMADGLAQVTLHERGSVRSSLFAHANDVAAIGPDRFYVANARLPHAGFISLLKAYLTRPRATIVYYNGEVPRVVAEGLRSADGLAVSPDGAKLYVTQMLGRDILTYDIQPISGGLVPVDDYSLPAALAHIDVDASGALWVAGHPKLFALADYARDAARPSPSEIFRVTLSKGLPAGFAPVYVGLGHRIGAAGTGVFAGGQLLIASPLDDKILECTPR